MFLIENAKIVGEEGLKNILVAGGKIEKIFEGSCDYPVDEKYDADGKTIIPGLIDNTFTSPAEVEKADSTREFQN